MSRVYVSLAVLLLITVSGCKNDSEAAISDVVSKQKDVVKILKGVTDKDSAVAAKSKLESLAKEVTELGKKYGSKTARTDEMKKAEEKYKPEMEQTQKEMEVEMKRVAQIPGAMEPIGEGIMTLATSFTGLANMKP